MKSWKLKFALTVLLGLSIFAFVAAVIRTWQQYFYTKQIDYTWNTIPILIWQK